MLEMGKKKDNKGWLTLRIQRLFCGEEECEKLQHVAERRLSEKDMAEDAVTAWDCGKRIVRTPHDGWGRPHSAILVLSAFLDSQSLSGCQGLLGSGLFLCSFLTVGWKTVFLCVSM